MAVIKIPSLQPNEAALIIRIWAEKGKYLPDDLAEAFAPHVEHVNRMVADDYTSGEIVDDNFSGWWEIKG